MNTGIRTIRTIEERDNKPVAALIRSVLGEFKAALPGTAYYDPTTDELFELFKTKNAEYFIAKEAGRLLGGSGIFPTPNLPHGCCELVKLYVHPDGRGSGLGKALMQQCFQAAKDRGYTHIYLETLPQLHIAVGLYEKMGFSYLPGPLGNSGHFACDLWMIKQLC